MMWVALATAIMMSSGEGDDFGGLGRAIAAFRAAVTEVIDDVERRDDALRALDETEEAIGIVVETSVAISACLEAADRSYEADRETYAACGRAYDDSLRRTAEAYSGARARFDAAVAPGEWRAIDASVTRTLSP